MNGGNKTDIVIFHPAALKELLGKASPVRVKSMTRNIMMLSALPTALLSPDELRLFPRLVVRYCEFIAANGYGTGTDAALAEFNAIIPLSEMNFSHLSDSLKRKLHYALFDAAKNGLKLAEWFEKTYTQYVGDDYEELAAILAAEYESAEEEKEMFPL